MLGGGLVSSAGTPSATHETVGAALALPKIRLLSGRDSRTRCFLATSIMERGTCLESAVHLLIPTLVILEAAFDEAWITLKSNGSGNIRPDELARRICHLAMEGERDPVRLHDRALLELVPATSWRELS